MKERPLVIGREVLYRQGCYSRERLYWEGHHPELGMLHFGHQGKETIQERDVVRPLGTFFVAPAADDVVPYPEHLDVTDTLGESAEKDKVLELTAAP